MLPQQKVSPHQNITTYKLLENVRIGLLPVYQRLADKGFLQRGQRGKIHNSNEALHSLIWGLAPKEKHASLFAVEAAIAEAVMCFNAGMAEASSTILQELHLHQNCTDGKRAA